MIADRAFFLSADFSELVRRVAEELDATIGYEMTCQRARVQKSFAARIGRILVFGPLLDAGQEYDGSDTRASGCRLQLHGRLKVRR